MGYYPMGGYSILALDSNQRILLANKFEDLYLISVSVLKQGIWIGTFNGEHLTIESHQSVRGQKKRSPRVASQSVTQPRVIA